MNGIFALADRLKKLDEEKKRLEEELKRVNAEKAIVEDELLPQAMIDEEIQNFSRGGRIFYLTKKVFVSAVADKKPELYEALRENNLGDLIQETVNANTLRATVKGLMEENDDTVPPWLEGLVSVTEKTSVGMRRASK